MDNHQEVFRSNTLMILVPGLFFGAALILRNQNDLYMLMWILLALGALATIAVVRGFTKITIDTNQLRIQNFRKNQVVNKIDIIKQKRSVSTAKGIETVVWKLHLKSGEVASISSDLIKEQERLKKSLDQFLRGKPKK
ncbi:hypothetical protein [Ekhidna sp.]|jgi:hypothetical protein|uniref:hypothetical protein n=1 Tax=Ekhidna sp. TaxID=2608089 RepID=UPI0032ECC0C1